MNEFDYAGTENWCGCRLIKGPSWKRQNVGISGDSRKSTLYFDGYVAPFRLLDISVLLRTKSSRFPARLFACDFPVGVRFVEKIR